MFFSPFGSGCPGWLTHLDVFWGGLRETVHFEPLNLSFVIDREGMPVRTLVKIEVLGVLRAHRALIGATERAQNWEKCDLSEQIFVFLSPPDEIIKIREREHECPSISREEEFDSPRGDGSGKASMENRGAPRIPAFHLDAELLIEDVAVHADAVMDGGVIYRLQEGFDRLCVGLAFHTSSSSLKKFPILGSRVHVGFMVLIKEISDLLLIFLHALFL